MDMTVMKGFVKVAEMGLSKKEEILEKRDELEKELDLINKELADLEEGLTKWDEVSESTDASIQREVADNYGTEPDLQERRELLLTRRSEVTQMFDTLTGLLEEYKNFNKSKCFANIRELLKQNPDVKIGQIEKEAGIRLGYMSRLDKEGNTSEPSMEFIVSAAKLLKVSIDTLVTVDLTGLTPTEQYIVNFFDKLKADTLTDKLDWVRESAYNLNRLEPDYNGYVWHPLFNEETFSEESEGEYPKEVTRVVFTSKTFGPKTFICGDCFNLRLKNGTTLYLMDIEKSVHRTNDPSAYAKEAWICVPDKGSSLLVASQDDTPVAPLLETLFTTVKQRMEHPKINKDIMYAIDSFMKDDLDDDPLDDNLPF